MQDPGKEQVRDISMILDPGKKPLQDLGKEQCRIIARIRCLQFLLNLLRSRFDELVVAVPEFSGGPVCGCNPLTHPGRVGSHHSESDSGDTTIDSIYFGCRK